MLKKSVANGYLLVLHDAVHDEFAANGHLLVLYDAVNGLETSTCVGTMEGGKVKKERQNVVSVSGPVPFACLCNKRVHKCTPTCTHAGTYNSCQP